MVLKGRKEGSYDYRKYFIRLLLKNKKNIEFGYTWKNDIIKDKYSKIIALVKGIILPKVASYYIKDESDYVDYNY